jgi:L-ribulose-5-phosphate 3-epimerase
MDRRTFLQTVGAAPLFSSVRPRADAGTRVAQAFPASAKASAWHAEAPEARRRQASAGPRKAVLISMLPKGGSYAERFAIARDAGFDAIEMQTVARQDEAAEIREASKRSGVRIHSVMNADHWRFPLSSGDANVVGQSVAGMETSLRNAALWGADAVLLVPAVVDATTSYREAWRRSQQVIRERLLPMARELKVIVAIEEVWNKFLLSPIEFAAYVDELDSAWAKAYFDVGNVVFYAFPQDWIRTLGARIAKVHLKDFQLDRPGGRFAWRNLGEGDIDWIEVRKAFTDVGYRGYMTTELADGDAAYLKDVAARVDRFLAGQQPRS